MLSQSESLDSQSESHYWLKNYMCNATICDSNGDCEKLHSEHSAQECNCEGNLLIIKEKLSTSTLNDGDMYHVNDGEICMCALFTTRALQEAYQQWQDDSSLANEDLSYSCIVVRHSALEFLYHEELEKSLFRLVVFSFTIMQRDDSFVVKGEPFHCSDQPEIRQRLRMTWEERKENQRVEGITKHISEETLMELLRNFSSFSTFLSPPKKIAGVLKGEDYPELISFKLEELDIPEDEAKLLDSFQEWKPHFKIPYTQPSTSDEQFASRNQQLDQLLQKNHSERQALFQQFDLASKSQIMVGLTPDLLSDLQSGEAENSGNGRHINEDESHSGISFKKPSENSGKMPEKRQEKPVNSARETLIASRKITTSKNCLKNTQEKGLVCDLSQAEKTDDVSYIPHKNSTEMTVAAQHKCTNSIQGLKEISHKSSDSSEDSESEVDRMTFSQACQVGNSLMCVSQVPASRQNACIQVGESLVTMSDELSSGDDLSQKKAVNDGTGDIPRNRTTTRNAEIQGHMTSDGDARNKTQQDEAATKDDFPRKNQSPRKNQPPRKLYSPRKDQASRTIYSPRKGQSLGKNQSPEGNLSPRKDLSPRKTDSQRKILSPRGNLSRKDQSPRKCLSPSKNLSPRDYISPRKDPSPRNNESFKSQEPARKTESIKKNDGVNSRDSLSSMWSRFSSQTKHFLGIFQQPEKQEVVQSNSGSDKSDSSDFQQGQRIESSEELVPVSEENVPKKPVAVPFTSEDVVEAAQEKIILSCSEFSSSLKQSSEESDCHESNKTRVDVCRSEPIQSTQKDHLLSQRKPNFPLSPVGPVQAADSYDQVNSQVDICRSQPIQSTQKDQLVSQRKPDFPLSPVGPVQVADSYDQVKSQVDICRSEPIQSTQKNHLLSQRKPNFPFSPVGQVQFTNYDQIDAQVDTCASEPIQSTQKDYLPSQRKPSSPVSLLGQVQVTDGNSQAKSRTDIRRSEPIMQSTQKENLSSQRNRPSFPLSPVAGVEASQIRGLYLEGCTQGCSSNLIVAKEGQQVNSITGEKVADQCHSANQNSDESGTKGKRLSISEELISSSSQPSTSYSSRQTSSEQVISTSNESCQKQSSDSVANQLSSEVSKRGAEQSEVLQLRLETDDEGDDDEDDDEKCLDKDAQKTPEKLSSPSEKTKANIQNQDHSETPSSGEKLGSEEPELVNNDERKKDPNKSSPLPEVAMSPIKTVTSPSSATPSVSRETVPCSSTPREPMARRRIPLIIVSEDTGVSETGACDRGASETGASETGASETGESETGASSVPEKQKLSPEDSINMKYIEMMKNATKTPPAKPLKKMLNIRLKQKRAPTNLKDPQSVIQAELFGSQTSNVSYLSYYNRAPSATKQGSSKLDTSMRSTNGNKSKRQLLQKSGFMLLPEHIEQERILEEQAEAEEKDVTPPKVPKTKKKKKHKTMLSSSSSEEESIVCEDETPSSVKKRSKRKPNKVVSATKSKKGKKKQTAVAAEEASDSDAETPRPVSCSKKKRNKKISVYNEDEDYQPPGSSKSQKKRRAEVSPRKRLNLKPPMKNMTPVASRNLSFSQESDSKHPCLGKVLLSPGHSQADEPEDELLIKELTSLLEKDMTPLQTNLSYRLPASCVDTLISNVRRSPLMDISRSSNVK